jgi:two-component system, OmpR family, response regulator ChvI
VILMKRILIVDDDHDITLAFKRGLEGPEFSVDVYNDPSLALSEFKPNTYHLLLLDVRMPKMNGFELYREFQKVDKSVKVCFITAFEVYYQALKEVFPTLEIDCFIKKPIEMSELAKKVKLEVNS